MPPRSLIHITRTALAGAALFCAHALAGNAVTEAAWARGDGGIVIVQANWGRQWPCAEYENAQLVAIEFRQQDPPAGTRAERLVLETPGMLRVDDRFTSYAYLLPPGTYALSGFEIKAAKSVRDVGRIQVDNTILTRNGQQPGSFRIGAGEIVYIGGFGLDCTYEPMPWRYYLESREAFEEEIALFRRRYPFTADTPVRYRLFESALIAQPPQFPAGQEPPMEPSATPPSAPSTDTAGPSAPVPASTAEPKAVPAVGTPPPPAAASATPARHD